MSETNRLRPAEPEEVAYALSFDGRKHFRHAREFTAQITAEHLMRHLHEGGYVSCKRGCSRLQQVTN